MTQQAEGVERHILAFEMETIKEGTMVCSCGWSETLSIGWIRLAWMMTWKRSFLSKLDLAFTNHAIDVFSRRLGITFDIAERHK